LAVTFFLILAPSSSVVPIKDLAFEHRMYLPLAPLITLVVLGGYAASARLAQRLGRDPQSRAALQYVAPAAAVVLVGGVLGYRTILRNQDYRSEQVIWEDTVSKRPQNARARVNLANAHFGLGGHRQAIDQYTQAIALQPDYATAYNNRGNVYQHLGDRQRAMADYERAIAADATYRKAYHNRGNIYRDRGEHDLAVQDYTTAIELDPTAASSYVGRGNCYLAEGKLRRAIHDYTDAIEHQPTLTEAYTNRARAYVELRRYQDAIDDYSKAIVLEPNLVMAYRSRAVLLLRTGQSERAWADIRMLRRLGAPLPPDLVRRLRAASPGP
jgi:tetratricopeptide (TPR) repeat protein